MAKSSTSFKPGQSGNPNGRPPLGRSMTELMRKYLDEVAPEHELTRKEEFVAKVAHLAYQGDFNAMKLIWNYLEGMPLQRNELTGANGQEFKFIIKADGYRNPKHRNDDESPSGGTDRPD